MKKKRRILSTFLAACMVTSSMVGMSVTASADDPSYTITIPSTLDVSGAGYTQLTGGITATGSNISGKLTVSAESAHTWNLQETNDSNKNVPYKRTSNNTGDPTVKTEWKFTPDNGTINGSENVYVYIAKDDYNNADPGTYQDTVTFTAKVEDAAPVLSGALVDGATIKVNFKWSGLDRGDYVQGVYNASSGTFTVTKGGDSWGASQRAVYKVEKSGDTIIIGAGYYDYVTEAMVWSFDTTNDTYTYTQGRIVSKRPDNYGLTSVTLNGTDITSQLTQNT